MPIPLIQRSILIVASQLMTFRAAERYLVLAGLLLIMLMAHALMQPYEAKRDNRTQTLLLAVRGRAALRTPLFGCASRRSAC